MYLHWIEICFYLFFIVKENNCKLEKEMKKNIKNAEANLVPGLDCVFTGLSILRVFGSVSLDHVII